MQHFAKLGEINIWYFKRRIQEIASLGGDSAVNCSLVGGIIGVALGYDKLPKDWILNIALIRREYMNSKIDHYVNAIL